MVPPRLHPLPLLLVLLGCGGVASDSKEGSLPSTDDAQDGDGDGVDAIEDCDDSDASIYPGATELCDGVDNDCDELTDEEDPDVQGMLVANVDEDGDGFGDPDRSREVCTIEPGVVDDDTDCDDTDPDRNPAATEIWYDGVDQDCSGGSDHDADADGEDADAHGGTDCDDGDSAISTAATETINGTDDDCNGLVDDGTTAYDDDGDGYSEDDGDCDDADASANPAASEVCGDGIDNDCSGGDAPCGLSGTYPVSDFGDEVYGPDVDNYVGFEVAVADFDGDGTDELMSAGGSFLAPAAYLWPDAPVGSEAADVDSWQLTYPSPYNGCNSGYGGPISPGDVNNDGYADLLASCSNGNSAVGATWLIHGPLTAGGAMGSLASGTTVGERISVTARLHALGDLNDDGFDDLAIGSHNWNYGSYADVGKMYIVYGPHSANLDFSVDNADIELYPDDRSYQWLGDGDAYARDFTGDGVSDLLQTHFWDDPNGSYSGSIGFFEGPVSSGSTVIYDADLGFIYGQSSDDKLGYSVEVADDIDGDGLPDLVIASLQLPPSGVAKVYVVTDPPAYGQNIQDVAAATITGTSTWAGLGHGLAVADVNFDGQDDILAGAPYAGASREGAVFLFHGPLTGSLGTGDADVTIEGDAANASLGYRLGRPTDLDADGLLDLAVGAPYDDTQGSYSGTLHLIYGL